MGLFMGLGLKAKDTGVSAANAIMLLWYHLFIVAEASALTTSGDEENFLLAPTVPTATSRAE